MKPRKTTRIDMHIHTRGSDGWGSPDEIARKAIERGLDGIVIADHHRTFTKEGNEVAAVCIEAGLMVFRGCEYSSDQGHVLVYGVPVEKLGYRKFYQPIQKFIEKVRAKGGVAIPAHPFHGYRKFLGGKVRNLTGIPALEGRNGQCEVRYPTENTRAMEEAVKLGLRAIGGSDAHNPDYVGCCYTEFKGWIDTDAKLVRALLKGSYQAMRNARVLEALSFSWRKWTRHSRKTDWLFDHRTAPAQTSLDSRPEMSQVGRHGKEANHDFETWQRDFYGESLDDPFYYSDSPDQDPSSDARPDSDEDSGPLVN